MSKTVQGTQTQGIEGAQAEKPQTKEELMALVDAQGGPMVEPGSSKAGQVDAMLAKAGLGTSVGGVKGAGAAAAVDGVDKSSGVSQANLEKLYGPGDSQIKAPTPPKVELTEELQVGAETFVGNMDQIVNDMFMKNGAMPEHTESMKTRGLTEEQAFQEIFYGAVNGDQVRSMAEGELLESQTGLAAGQGAGLGTTQGAMGAGESGGAGGDQAGAGAGGAQGAGGATSAEMQAAIDEINNGVLGQLLTLLPDNGHGPIQFDKTGTPILPPNFTLEDVFTAANFKNVAQGVLANGGTLAAGKSGMITEADMRKLTELSADMLLALFLKLNITDPNNSPETHNMLHKISSDLRQLGLKEAIGRNELAALKMKQASEYAAKAKTAGIVIMIITIIISLIITIFTFGAGVGAAVAATTAVNVAIQGATQAAVQVATQAAVQTAVQSVVQAAVQAGTQAAVQAAIQAAAQVGTQALTQAMVQIAVQAFTQGMMQAVQQMMVQIIIAIVVCVVLQIMNVAVQKESQDQSLDAQQTENAAKKAQQWADKHQAVVEEEAAIMKLIMEAKNQVVDAVMKMMNAMFATQTKVMAAGMTR